MERLLDWFDHRTGYRAIVRAALYENIPGGSRWRYVWGSTLVFTFSIQVVTGLFLWMAYNPSATTAWESVYYIQYEMQGGWLLRGIHHYTAQAMILLLVLHFCQIVIDRAYKAPREVNFWLGLILMMIVLGLSLSGYLLPWDQKGYYGTRVATNLIGLVPGVGADVQRLVVGGSDYGHATLTRFFAMHGGILPALLILFLVLHVMVFRRHGIHAVDPEKGPDHTFWPDQILKDAVACLAVLAGILFLTTFGMWGGGHEGQVPGDYLGAELGAPADPASGFPAARPEWYFLFLFQFLKYFPGSLEIIGALVIPGMIMAGLFLMPLLGRWKLGHRFNLGFVAFLLLGALTLTLVAIREDGDNAKHQAALETAEVDRERVIDLARSPTGIPAEGAVTLLREDPKTQGPILFESRCASCHSHVPKEEQPDVDARRSIASRDPSAPNLYEFASREWIRGLLNADHIDGVHYFGNTDHSGEDMVTYVQDDMSDEDEWSAEDIENVVIALSAEAKLQSQREADERDQDRIAAGRELIADEGRCAQCHKFGDAGDLGEAPDLTGYGSREWLIDFIRDPSHERFYDDGNDRMRSYAKEPGDSPNNILRTGDIEMMAEWIRGEWYEPGRDDAGDSAQSADSPE